MTAVAGDGVAPDAGERLASLAARAAAFADGIRFTFLYDAQRRLFSIGYRLADGDRPGRLDPSYYDLLASEARLASFIAIARGEVPQTHWFHLGRLLTSVGGSSTLLSWSAHPVRVPDAAPGPAQLPGHAARPDLPDGGASTTALRRRSRRRRGGSRSRPATSSITTRPTSTRPSASPAWASSAGSATSWWSPPTPPRLPPWSSRPRRPATCAGSRRRGWWASTASTRRSTTPTGSASDDESPEPAAHGTVVRSYMAHHQGMTLVAIANALLGHPMVERFHADPRVCATELLLQERVPRLAPITKPRPAEETRTSPPAPSATVRRFLSPHTAVLHAQFLGNGNYTVVITNAGGGASFCRGLAVTRFRRDATSDPCGQSLYLRDVRSGAVWNATYQPTGKEPEDYRVTFQAGQSDLPPPRRRDRDPARDRRLDRGRRRGAPPDGDESERSAARDRGDELRRDRARSSRRRSRPSGVRQAVRGERVPRRGFGIALPAPPTVRRRGRDLGGARARLRGQVAGPGGVGDRPREVPRTRARPQ